MMSHEAVSVGLFKIREILGTVHLANFGEVERSLRSPYFMHHIWTQKNPTFAEI